nr:PREDICTED: ERI1 exoribonuclease 2 [Lepisosteus oculatus]
MPSFCPWPGQCASPHEPLTRISCPARAAPRAPRTSGRAGAPAASASAGRLCAGAATGRRKGSDVAQGEIQICASLRAGKHMRNPVRITFQKLRKVCRVRKTDRRVPWQQSCWPRKLGLIRKRSQPSSNGAQRRPGAKQFFSYLVVIDFESTCWRDKNHCSPEIIEFPAVLLNTSNGRIDSEFHTYVQPQEHPTLSEFCTELTGIRQSQVEAGVPLKICLSQFNKWLQTLQQEENIVFVNDLVRPSDSVANPCTFVTWSDWDLGVCLQYECKRKQLHRPDALNSWIDLRAMYKSFYNRKPKGLTGALQDLGIKFSGREHSGLDDARNTAHLAWRMITDGCVMKITKCLERVKPDPGNRCANSEAARDNHHGNCVARGENNTEDRQTKSVLEQV